MTEPPHDVIRRTARRPVLDGQLDACPWTDVQRSASFTDLVTGRPTRPALPPWPGDLWRMAFARFQILEVGTNRHQAGRALTPQGVRRKNSDEIHEPEKFSRVLFPDEVVPEGAARA